MWKKIIITILIVAVITGGIFAILSFTGNKTNIEGSLEDLMAKLYSEIPEDEMPMMIENFEINDENKEGFLGTNEIEFEEAIASESAIGAIAHSVVLLRTKDSSEAKNAVTQIEKSIDPRKWICVEAEKTIVKNKGNLVVLIMTFNDTAETIEKSFDNLQEK